MYKINLLFECLRGNLNQFNRASFGIGIEQKPLMTERDAVNLTLSVRIPHRQRSRLPASWVEEDSSDYLARQTFRMSCGER